MKIRYFLVLIFFLSSCFSNNDLRQIHLGLGSESSEPFLLSSKDNLFLSWTEEKEDSVFLYQGKIHNDKLIDKKLINKGVDWFVNWADFPSISYNDINGNMMSFNLKKSSAATFSYDVIYHIKNNGIWTNKKKLHNDNTFTEHGFVSIQPYNEGFIASWLDGRNTKLDPNYSGHHGNGSMSLRSAIINNKGDIIDENLVDNKVCDCCQTSMTISNGIPILVYRDRTDDEKRDISISRYVNNKWTESRPINDDNWIINGCPVNGPNIDSYEDNVVVSWFSASNGIPKVNIKFSNDRGSSFGDKILVNDINNKPIGRVDVEFLDKDEVLVSWLSSDKGKGYLNMRKINVKGNLGDIISLDDISSQRSTGFPQIEKFLNDIYISWTDSDGNSKNVKTYRLPVSYL